jgi:NADPH:quinone reductase-like Zn-dependent oxidoreductase
LINGASGGVGTFAVQIAKSFGAEVTGVCSTRNLEMVRGLGADHVIDYTREDFIKRGQRYDLLVDNVGNRSVTSLQRILTPTGIGVIVGFSSLPRLLQTVILGRLVSKKEGQKIGLMGEASVNKQDLLFLKELLEAGKIEPVIDRSYPLHEVSEAIRYLETGHARGKVVITVA